MQYCFIQLPLTCGAHTSMFRRVKQRVVFCGSEFEKTVNTVPDVSKANDASKLPAHCNILQKT